MYFSAQTQNEFHKDIYDIYDTVRGRQVLVDVNRHRPLTFIPGAARWLCCAASLCTAEPPGSGPAVGAPDSESEDWTPVSCTDQPDDDDKRQYKQIYDQ